MCSDRLDFVPWRKSENMWMLSELRSEPRNP
jgi:hypothetical protein